MSIFLNETNFIGKVSLNYIFSGSAIIAKLTSLKRLRLFSFFSIFICNFQDRCEIAIGPYLYAQIFGSQILNFAPRILVFGRIFIKALNSKNPSHIRLKYWFWVCSGDLAYLGHKWTKYGRGCTTGTGGRLGSGIPSKVWSRVLVCWSTAI